MLTKTHLSIYELILDYQQNCRTLCIIRMDVIL